MAENVVEGGGILADFEDVALADLDVLQRQPTDQPPTIGDLPRGKLHADETALRVTPCQWNQVAPARAAKLEYAALPRVGGRQAEKVPDDGQPVGVRLGDGGAVVGNLVVAVHGSPLCEELQVPRRGRHGGPGVLHPGTARVDPLHP